MINAVVVGVLISLCASLLGTSLVLKRYSMIGDGLSHVGFASLSIATALQLTPLQVSIPVVVLAAFFLLRISENSKIKGDAAIALISSSALSIGVIVTSLSTGMNVDVYNYMFGSILAMSSSDVKISIILSLIVLILFVFSYHRIFAITFDENFAKATGISTSYYNMLIALLTALTIVVGMRMMGSLLISSLIIFPSLTSMRVFGGFKQVVISSAILSVVCFLLGILTSFVLDIPTGASVVVVNLIAFLGFSCCGVLPEKERGKLFLRGCFPFYKIGTMAKGTL